MIRRSLVFAVPLALIGVAPIAAQEATPAPLSSIDWMKEVLHQPVATPKPSAPKRDETATATSAAISEVTVQQLDDAPDKTIGLLASSVTGLPADLWLNSNSARLAGMIERLGTPRYPALQDLMRLLLLAETDTPKDSPSDQTLLLARIDALMAMGSIDAAYALAQRARPFTSPLLERLADGALLTGQEDEVCTLWKDTPGLAFPTALRVFCLSRAEDWLAASLTLDTGAALGQISDTDAAMLTLFLDPELASDTPPQIPSHQLTPLQYRLMEAIGNPLPTRSLPTAFAAADLRQNSGWKARLEAAERLGRVGALPDNQLLGIFTEKQPSASGQIWDRVEAMQRLDAALSARDPASVNRHLGPAIQALEPAGLLVPLARLYAQRLSGLPLTPEAKAHAQRLGYLSAQYETFASADMPFATAIATGQTEGVVATTTTQQEVLKGFTQAPLTRDARLVKDEKLGQAILNAMFDIEQAKDGDVTHVADGLALLRAVGLEDYARRAALQVLLL